MKLVLKKESLKDRKYFEKRKEEESDETELKI